MKFGTWHHRLQARQLRLSDIFAPFGLVPPISAWFFILGLAPLAFDFTLSAARQQWFEMRVSSPRQTVFLDLRALSTRAGAYNTAPARVMNPSLDMWGVSEGTVVPPTALPQPW